MRWIALAFALSGVACGGRTSPAPACPDPVGSSTTRADPAEAEILDLCLGLGSSDPPTRSASMRGLRPHLGPIEGGSAQLVEVARAFCTQQLWGTPS